MPSTSKHYLCLIAVSWMKIRKAPLFFTPGSGLQHTTIDSICMSYIPALAMFMQYWESYTPSLESDFQDKHDTGWNPESCFTSWTFGNPQQSLTKCLVTKGLNGMSRILYLMGMRGNFTLRACQKLNLILPLNFIHKVTPSILFVKCLYHPIHFP